MIKKTYKKSIEAIDRLENILLDSPKWDWLAIIAIILSLVFSDSFSSKILILSTPDASKAIAGPAGIIAAITFAALSVLISHTKSSEFTRLHRSGSYAALFEALWAGIRRFGILSLLTFTSSIFPAFAGPTLSFLIACTFSLALLNSIRVVRLLKLAVNLMIKALEHRAHMDDPSK